MKLAIIPASFTRPNDTTAYDIDDLIANSTTANQVVPMELVATRAFNSPALLRRARIFVNDTAFAGKIIRARFYRNKPVPANGDNAAYSTDRAEYLGRVDVLLDETFTDGAGGIGIPVVGSDIMFMPKLGTQSIFALLAARSAVTPAAQKIFTLEAECIGGD